MSAVFLKAMVRIALCIDHIPVLVDQSHGSRVRAIEASNDWPVEKLRKYLRNRLLLMASEPRSRQWLHLKAKHRGPA
jgi:hypothetical protein